MCPGTSTETIMANESDSRTIPDGPLSMVRELPPGPLEQCTTEELTSFVANISLFTRGRAPQEKERLLARMREAMDVLKARGTLMLIVFCKKLTRFRVVLKAFSLRSSIRCTLFFAISIRT